MIQPSLSALDGAYIGIGPEVNGLSRDRAAIGGGLLAGFNLNRHMSIGQRTSFFHNTNTVNALELLGFFRYYLPWTLFTGSPFVQAEAGGVMLFEQSEVFPAFSGGLSAGLRFLIQSSSVAWFVEPALRLGTPHIWGVSLTVGLRLRSRTANNEQLIMINEEPGEDSDFDELFTYLAGRLRDSERVRVPVRAVIFRLDHADFTGLSEDIIESNTLALERVARVLEQFGDCSIEVIGFANPTTPEGPLRQAEEPSLLRLSEDRARRVIDELVGLGAERGRLSYYGAGGSSTVVSFGDRDSAWQNRRVEFYLSGNRE